MCMLDPFGGYNALFHVEQSQFFNPWPQSRDISLIDTGNKNLRVHIRKNLADPLTVFLVQLRRQIVHQIGANPSTKLAPTQTPTGEPSLDSVMETNADRLAVTLERILKRINAEERVSITLSVL